MNLGRYNSESKPHSSRSSDTVVPKAAMKHPAERGDKKLLYIIFGVLFVIVAAAAVFFFLRYNQVASNPTSVLDEQSKAIKDSVSKLMLLDDSESITVKIISDADSVKKDNPDFFKNAKNQDYVLISPTRAIIYRKDVNLIINVAPIIQNSDAGVTTVATPTPTPTKK